MATPVFACGCECGVIAASAHMRSGTGSPTIDTTTFRTGTRSLQINPSAAQEYVDLIGLVTAATRIFVVRDYLRFVTLPNADIGIVHAVSGSNGAAIYFQNSDDKLYCATFNGTTWVLGSTGITVTTGVWYRFDARINMSANPWTVDLQVDAVAAGQATRALAAATPTALRVGASVNNSTCEMYFDDFLISQTTGDYPLGEGEVRSFLPNADGTHNVSSANNWERSATGVDIDNATTDSYLLIDDLPLKSGGSPADYILCILQDTPGTEYVENAYADSVSATPRSVEAIYAERQAGTNTGNLRIALRDSNGATQADIGNNTRAGVTTIRYVRNHFAVIPGAGAWTLTAFNALRTRSYSSDDNPDQWICSIMLEAEFITQTQNLAVMTATAGVPNATAALKVAAAVQLATALMPNSTAKLNALQAVMTSTAGEPNATVAIKVAQGAMLATANMPNAGFKLAQPVVQMLATALMPSAQTRLGAAMLKMAATALAPAALVAVKAIQATMLATAGAPAVTAGLKLPQQAMQVTANMPSLTGALKAPQQSMTATAGTPALGVSFKVGVQTMLATALAFALSIVRLSSGGEARQIALRADITAEAVRGNPGSATRERVASVRDLTGGRINE